MELAKEAYVAKHSVKTTSVCIPSEADCQSMTSSSIWKPSEYEAKKMQLVKVCYSKDTSLQKE